MAKAKTDKKEKKEKKEKVCNTRSAVIFRVLRGGRRGKLVFLFPPPPPFLAAAAARLAAAH